jgi:ankyrin repeat protein
MMIEKGADINAQTRIGVTPLHACSETGVLEIVDLLLSAGANVNLADW